MAALEWRGARVVAAAANQAAWRIVNMARHRTSAMALGERKQRHTLNRKAAAKWRGMSVARMAAASGGGNGGVRRGGARASRQALAARRHGGIWRQHGASAKLLA